MSFPELTRTARLNGVDLAWDCWGAQERPTLVLCHGFTGTLRDFDLHLEALVDAGSRVLVLEHRGHGASGRSPDPEHYRIAQLAADLADFLVAVTDGPVDLVGHSMGGRIALEAALERPDTIRSLVLMDTSAWSFTSNDPAVADRVAAFLTAFDPADGLPQVTRGGPEDVLVDAATDPVWRQARSARQQRVDPHAVKQLGMELFVTGVTPLTDRLGELTCPTTVLVGSLDEPYASQARELAQALPRGRLHVIDGAHHAPQVTHQSQWRAAVAAHLGWARSTVSAGLPDKGG